MTYKEHIQKRLTELRQEHGHTQEAVGAAAGVTGKAYGRWERGETSPDVGQLATLAEFYGVDIVDIIGKGNGEMLGEAKAGGDQFMICREPSPVYIDHQTLHLPDDLEMAIEFAAKSQSVTFNEMIVRLLRIGLNRLREE